jgi:hypothetical protein
VVVPVIGAEWAEPVALVIGAVQAELEEWAEPVALVIGAV